jgi:predicted metal-dependent peptidase
MMKVGSYVRVKGTDKYGRIDNIDKGKYEIDPMSRDEMMDDVIKKKDQKTNHGKKEKHTAEELIPVVFGNSSLHQKGDGSEGDFEDETIATDPKEKGKDNKEGEGSGEDDPVDIEIFTRKLVQKAKEMEKHIPKTAGNEVGGLTRTIERLLEPKVSWKSILKRHLNLYYSRNSAQKEQKKSFITYPWNPKSRYGILCKHHIETVAKLQNYVIIAMDTSGSVFGSAEEMETFFSEMEGMAKWFSFTKTGQLLTIMWDADIAEGLTEYKHKDWSKFSTGKRKVLGGGGTTPQVVFKYFDKVYENKENFILVKDKGVNFMIPDKKKLPFVIFLTDGYFFGKLKKKEMGPYKDCPENVLFFTRSKDCLPKESNYIIYE